VSDEGVVVAPNTVQDEDSYDEEDVKWFMLTASDEEIENERQYTDAPLPDEGEDLS
jgi:2-phosphoglycerate kinase